MHIYYNIDRLFDDDILTPSCLTISALAISWNTFHHLKFHLWKKGLAAESMTLWDSICWSSSQARVTSAKSKSEWSDLRVSVAADSNLFHFKEYLSSVPIFTQYFWKSAIQNLATYCRNRENIDELLKYTTVHYSFVLINWESQIRDCFRCSTNIWMEMT